MPYSSNVFSRIFNTYHLVGDQYFLENQQNRCDFIMVMMIMIIIIVIIIIMWSTY